MLMLMEDIDDDAVEDTGSGGCEAGCRRTSGT